MPLKKTLEVINRMRQDGVIEHYAIGGAVGATFYVEAAATLDVYIFVFLPQAGSSTLLTLSPIYEKQGFKAEKEYVVIGKWPVQFLSTADGLEEDAIRKAIRFSIEGIETGVMPAEYLVAIALKTGRVKDHARIVEFVQRKVVNPSKLKAVLSRHVLDAKWQTFQKKYLAQ